MVYRQENAMNPSILGRKYDKITGLDVPSEMIKLASDNHPGECFTPVYNKRHQIAERYR